jgi:putative ABC transport system ATP-binding protein
MADLEIRELTVEYTRGGYVVRPIDNLWLQGKDGQLVVLLGPSGCGKTTLLSCLGGILKPTKGLILFGSTVVSQLAGPQLTQYRQNGVGICFQAFNLIPSLSALENVAAPLLIAGVPQGQARGRAKALLERVDLAERMHHKPGSLSGGQQQRVAVARALAHDPPLLLADEPTANLDYIQAESVIRLVREIAAPGRMVVVSTHDDRMVPIADQVVELAPRFRSDTGPPQRVVFQAGETIFEQGSRGELIYVVDQGEVDIIRVRSDRTEEFIATVRTGEYFGELGPLLGFPRSASARARTQVQATAYGARDFKERVLSQKGARGVTMTGKREPGASVLGTVGQAPMRFCVNCGAPREPGDMFCGTCGFRLPDTPPAG